MSSASQVKRKRNALMEQDIKVPQSTEVTLSEEQYKEMSTIVSRIEEISKDELEKAFAERDAHGVGAQMWITDKEQLKQFNEDQARNSKLFTAEIRLVSFFFYFIETGKRSNKWNMITIRVGKMCIMSCYYLTFNMVFIFIALAVYTRSPAAYEALKRFGVLQLPSKSTLQAYTGSFLQEPGTSSQCIADQVAQYVMFKEECLKQGTITIHSA